MQYYKYLDIDWKPSADKLKDYILNDRTEFLTSIKSSSWRNLNVEEVIRKVPELSALFTPMGLTIHHMAFFVSDYKVGTIHIDHDRHSNCRINLPILNCEDTETRFYKTLVEPIKTLQANGVPFLNLDPAKCVQVDQFYLTQAVIFRNDQPHQVISNNPNTPRISCTIGFNEDIEYLFESLESHT